MTKAILSLIPLAQSVVIANENYKLVTKKNKKPKDFIGTGVKTIVGLELTKETQKIINSM